MNRSRSVPLYAAALISWILAAGICSAGHENPKDFDFIDDQGWGDWSGSLAGRIIDANGVPIAGAAIRVHSKDIVARTDHNGYFVIHGLQQGGRYSLIIGREGYRDGLARWIPIPRYYTADIGDYHLDPAPIQTNYFAVASNLVQGAWVTVTNVVEIDDDITNFYAAGSAPGHADGAAKALPPEWTTSGLPMLSENPAATNAPAAPPMQPGNDATMPATPEPPAAAVTNHTD